MEKKKATLVGQEDVVELWLAPISENPALARVHRVEVVDYHLSPERYDILAIVDKGYIVPNWKHNQ